MSTPVALSGNMETSAPPLRVGEQMAALMLAIIATTVGLVGLAAADMLARSSSPYAPWVFWPSIAIVVAPSAICLSLKSTSRAECMGAALLATVALYVVKVLYSPNTLIFSDEFLHLGNAQKAVTTGHLFHSNSILPETASYPGLEAVTSAVTSVTGLNLYVAAMVVVGAARIVLAIALFLLVEKTTTSSRVGGLAVVLYAGNPNFVFWSAQYSYESLALPLGIVFLYLISLRRDAKGRGDAGLLGAAVLIPAITVTHHITSYAIAIVALALAVRARRRRAEDGRKLWYLSGLAALSTALWLSLVARSTIGYLRGVLGRAGQGLLDVAAGRSGGRGLFETKANTYVAPLSIQLLTIVSTALLFVLLVVGVLAIRGGRSRDPFVGILILAGVGYFCTLPLRFAPSAWETGNRASEFLFVGLALAAAVGAGRLVGQFRFTSDRLVFAGALTLIVVGGIPAGWQARLLLPRTLAVRVNGATVDPPGFAIARWTRGALGTDLPMISDESNGRLLLQIASEDVFVGRHPYVNDLLQQPSFPLWQRDALHAMSTQYVLVDRRKVSWDNIAGYYFSPEGTALFSDKVFNKFTRAGANVILDAGNMRLYDVRGIAGTADSPATSTPLP